ncbi:MAG TPA: hypothetical protein VIQ03_09005 [Gammaproteobacteria bacterium]
MAKRRRYLQLDEPLRHRDHSRPVTRREFVRQGFIGGSAFALSGGVFSMFANPRQAMAAVSSDLNSLASDIGCALGGLSGDKKLPFICFDLAGGANFAGSNVLVGQAGGQMDLLTTSGYSKMGLPGDIIPGLTDTTLAGTMLSTSDGDFTNSQLGLKFHSDSAMLFGILSKFTPAPGTIDGTVIPARSDNDTGNNPHNPMYGIAKAGANGGVVTLIGSRNSESGGNSMAPTAFNNPEIRPTKVDRPSDVTGMVDVGDLTAVLSDPADVTAVMESMARISHKKIRLGTITPGVNVTKDEVIKDLLQCGYLKAADIAQRFAGVQVDPSLDTNIVNDSTGIFTTSEFNNDGEFRKTASVMKMVIDGHAGAGCITMGGYDYHTGDRQVGENRDLRAGRCIGACLEYARRMAQPVMIYVFSDGSVASNGRIDNSMPSGNNQLGGRGKGEWTGDNSSTACSFFLIFDPTGGITINSASGLLDHRQIGWYSGDGSVVTSSSPAANNVNLLVNTVIANYLSLNGDIGLLSSLVPNHGLGDVDRVVPFGPLANL